MQIGGDIGCCEIGKVCDTIICRDTQTTCGDYCCDAGDPCVTSNGEQVCSSSTTDTTTNVCSMEGYVPCPGLDICCPIGVTCIPPTSCDVQCGPNDLLCDAGGCCPQGQVCLPDNTCGQGRSGTLSPLRPSNTPTSTPRNTPIDTPNLSSSAPRVTTKRTTVDTTTTEDITPATPTSTTDSYTPPRISVLITTVSPNNAASFPTMGALLGGLGIAAGYLAM